MEVPKRVKDKLEVTICVICHKEYFRRKVKKGNGNSGRMLSIGSVRRINSKTCSPKCAREYTKSLNKK